MLKPMKILIIILAAVMLVIFIIQKVMAAANAKLERQAYRLVSRDGKFELRDYPSAVMATVHSSGNGEGRSENSNFRRLAGYIFGGNETSAKISMTAPVHMGRTDVGSTMQFVMPSQYKLEDLPKPLDPSISFSMSDSGQYAAVIFGGFTNPEKILEKEHELADWLKMRNLDIIGPFEVLGYNPPYELVDRRNEILVKVVERKNM